MIELTQEEIRSVENAVQGYVSREEIVSEHCGCEGCEGGCADALCAG